MNTWKEPVQHFRGSRTKNKSYWQCSALLFVCNEYNFQLITWAIFPVKVSSSKWIFMLFARQFGCLLVWSNLSLRFPSFPYCTVSSAEFLVFFHPPLPHLIWDLTLETHFESILFSHSNHLFPLNSNLSRDQSLKLLQVEAVLSRKKKKKFNGTVTILTSESERDASKPPSCSLQLISLRCLQSQTLFAQNVDSHLELRDTSLSCVGISSFHMNCR